MRVLPMKKILHVVDSGSRGTKRILEQQQFEGQIESRLKELENLITDMTNAPYLGLLREREPIRGALEELVVKKEALSWIARIANHSEGAVREMLWLDIEGALVNLEKNADRFVDAACA